MSPELEAVLGWVDAIAGHLLSWPVAIFLIALIFTKPIKEFIGRLEYIKVKDLEAQTQIPPPPPGTINEKLPKESLKRVELESEDKALSTGYGRVIDVKLEENVVASSKMSAEGGATDEEKIRALTEALEQTSEEAQRLQRDFWTANTKIIFWHFQYLHLFLAPISKKALHFIGQYQGINYQQLQAALGLNEQRSREQIPIIIAALGVNELIRTDDATQLLHITQRGKEYIKLIGPPPYSPILGAAYGSQQQYPQKNKK